MEATQVQQLKLNVTNINSFLKKSNKTYIGLKKQNSTLLSNQIQRKKQESKEKKIETRRATGFGLGKVGDKIASTGGSIFDKILGFGSFILAGVLVNSLPQIIKTVREVIDSIVEFVTPIQSAFNLIKAFMEGDFNKSKYDADKKIVDDKLEELNKDGGLIDQIAEQTGILEPLIKLLKPAVNQLRNAIGGKRKVLAVKGGKEGVKDLDTGEFTERQFTTSQREQYVAAGGQGATGPTAPQGVQGAGGGNEGQPHPDDPKNKVGVTNPQNRSNTGSKNRGLMKDKTSMIYLHWTGGFYNGTSNRYHRVFLGDGTMTGNLDYGSKTPGGHTYGRNTNAVGLSIAAMGHRGMRPDYYDSAKGFAETPPTAAQLNAMAKEAARLAVAWGWNESTINSNVMTHYEADFADFTAAEGGGTTRWDLKYLKHADRNKGNTGGPYMRKLILKYFRELKGRRSSSNQKSSTTQAQITPKTRDRNNRASVLNTTIGEEGSTTFVLMRQPVIT